MRKIFLFTLLLEILLATSLACTRDKSPVDTAPRTYTLVLTDTTTADGTAPVIAALRNERPARAVLAVSGYPLESPASLLQRLPWLLQPGVDTLYYDPALAGPELLKTLQDTLSMLSPTTTVQLLKY